MFTNAADVRAFALAGHATLTISSGRTGARYTYRITRARENNDNRPANVWFVGLLSSPDNEADYNYVGVVNGTFKLTAKSRYGEDSLPVRAFRYVWHHVDAGRMPPEVEIRHEGRCGRCGRKLTVPESIDRGIGPECATMV